MGNNNTISRMKYDRNIQEWICLISKGYMYDARLRWTPGYTINEKHIATGYAVTEVDRCDGLCIKDDLPFRVMGIIKQEIIFLTLQEEIKS